jgi:hypothetical protein
VKALQAFARSVFPKPFHHKPVEGTSINCTFNAAVNGVLSYLLHNPTRNLDPLFVREILNGFNSLFDRGNAHKVTLAASVKPRQLDFANVISKLLP